MINHPGWSVAQHIKQLGQSLKQINLDKTHSRTITQMKSSEQPERLMWLKSLIRSSGMSKRQFALWVDLPPSNFTTMTNGGLDISERTVYRIVAKTGAPPPPGMEPLPSFGMPKPEGSVGPKKPKSKSGIKDFDPNPADFKALRLKVAWLEAEIARLKGHLGLD